MPEYNRRTLVRGAAWSIPVVAVAAQVPAFAGSLNAPQPGTMNVTCRTTGQGGGNCHGYKVDLTFLVDAGASWNVTITTSQIVSSNGATLEIKAPLPFPRVVTSTDNTFNVWFCTDKSPSFLTLQVSYSVYKVGELASTAVTRTFLAKEFVNIPGC